VPPSGRGPTRPSSERRRQVQPRTLFDYYIPMRRDASRNPEERRYTWGIWLGINSSTAALLGAILLVTAATELWSPLIPQYIKSLKPRALAGDAAVILIIGLYGFYRDGLEALNYYAGGVLAARMNTRRSLLLFNVLPLAGLAVLFLWSSWAAVFVAIPFIFIWDSIAGPAVITVVGDSVPAARRTMAFSLQAIFRRVSRIMAYSVSGLMVWWLGDIKGVRADVLISIGLVLLSIGIQYRFMHTASRDANPTAIHLPQHLLRRFSPELRRLLAADIFARWAEGVAGPFIILFCVPLLAEEVHRGAGIYQAVLLNIQAVTNVVLYLAIGPLASREGLAKKPFIGLTFVFFALFPMSLILLGPTLGFWGLAAAFVVGGFREIGEPARKAMVAELVPAEERTQAIGLYWSARSVAVMWASPVGALLWLAGEWTQPGAGPKWTFLAAGIIGLIGAAMFFARFGLRRGVKA
jgi:MFS family permease